MNVARLLSYSRRLREMPFSGTWNGKRGSICALASMYVEGKTMVAFCPVGVPPFASVAPS